MNTNRWIPLVAVLPVLILFGCNAATETLASDASTSTPRAIVASKYSGVVDSAHGRFTFTPTRCAMHMEDGEMDIFVSGPGTAPDGEKIFVEFGSDTLNIELGVDSWADSSERTWKAGDLNTKKMKVDASGKTIRVAELELVNEQGERMAGSLEIHC